MGTVQLMEARTLLAPWRELAPAGHHWTLTLVAAPH